MDGLRSRTMVALAGSITVVIAPCSIYHKSDAIRPPAKVHNSVYASRSLGSCLPLTTIPEVAEVWQSAGNWKDYGT